MVQDREQQNDLLSIDIKNVLFYARLYSKVLFLCVVLGIGTAVVYVSTFRVDRFKSTLVLKMAESTPSSALSQMVANMMASESTAAKLETLNELLSSSEFSQNLAAKAMTNQDFYQRYVMAERLKPKYVEIRKPSSEGDTSPMYSQDYMEEFSNRLTGSFQFSSDPRSATIGITARHRDPWIAVQLAEMAGAATVELNYKRKVSQINSLKKFLSKQVQDLGERLNSFEIAQSSYQKINGIHDSEGRGIPILSRYNREQEDVLDLKRQMAANKDRIKSSQAELSDFKSRLNDPTFYKSNVYLNQLQFRMRSLAYELDLAKATPENGKANPDIEKIKAELTLLSNKYKLALSKASAGKSLTVVSPTQYYTELQKNHNDLLKEGNLINQKMQRAQASLAQTKLEIDKLPDQLRQYTSIKRNIALTSAIFIDTEKKLQEVRFMEAETINDLSILSHAKQPMSPDGMSVYRLALILVTLALALASFAIFCIEVFGQTIRAKADIDKTCDKFLGAIPKIETDLTDDFMDVKSTISKFKNVIQSNDNLPPMLVLEKLPDGRDADNFRSIRMHLFKLLKEDRSLADKACRVIMVTSPSDSAGTTFFSANLALTVAKSEKKVLLIDFDLRNPKIHTFFPKCESIDVANAFSGEGLNKSIRNYSKFLDVVAIKGTATHAPEILESQEIKQFIEDARKTYDYVIFASAAVLNVVDPLICLSFADLVVVTAQAQKTKREDYAAATRKIKNCVNLPIYGVLNFSDRRRDAAA